jgi:DNA polymerase III epsilon subunit-like protein
MDAENGYIIYVVDTETTGLDTEKNEVIEISASRFSMADPDNREQKTWYLKALSPETIQDRALDINKHKREDILHMTEFGRETYRDPLEVVTDFECWVMDDDMSAMDRIMAGQNIEFDIKMLKALWKRQDSETTFPFNLDRGDRTIDTKMLATAIDLCTGRRRRYYNLSTLVKSFGVKKRKAHRAEDDVAMTVDLLCAMLTPIVPPAGDAFKDCYTDLDE